MSQANGISTHVLDTALGRPAGAVPIKLEHHADNEWKVLFEGQTDADGRARPVAAGPLLVGQYRLSFDTGAYFAAGGVHGFYPLAQIVFLVRDGAAHYHVPLLLSPFGYSTYRGS